MRKAFVLLIIMLIFNVACQKPTNEVSNNLFNPKDVKVGDEVAGMKIVELEVGNDGPQYSVYATFEGKVLISGHFVQYEDHDFLGNAISFEVDEESSKKLPKLTYDERNLWFVFRNREEAIKLLGDYEYEGLTIEVDSYTINYAPTEVVNQASIIRVVEGVKKASTTPDEIEVRDIINLNFMPQPIAKLSYIDYNEKWKSLGNQSMKNISGVSEILVNYYQVDQVETKLILQDKYGFVDLDMSLEGEIDRVTLFSKNVNNEDGLELIVMVDRGSTYKDVKIYDYDGESWRCILASDNIIVVDIDNDGIDNLVSTSMGSLPPYISIYFWDGGQFLKSDVVADIGSVYATLSISKEGKNIIQAGDENKYKLYEYYDRKLYEMRQGV